MPDAPPDPTGNPFPPPPGSEPQPCAEPVKAPTGLKRVIEELKDGGLEEVIEQANERSNQRPAPKGDDGPVTDAQIAEYKKEQGR